MNNQADQLFIQEALELLQEIKEGLQGLAHEPNRNTTETLIRATQIIQGGAAPEKFSELSTLTRRLEQILGYLWREQIEIDSSLTDQLLTICDCIQSLLDQNPSIRQDPLIALAQAEPVLTDLELRLSKAQTSETVKCDFNEIIQTIEEFKLALETVEGDELYETLKNHANTLLSKSQSLDLQDIAAISQTMLASLLASPQSAYYIGLMALAGLQEIRKKKDEKRNTAEEESLGTQQPISQHVDDFHAPPVFETITSQSSISDAQATPLLLSDYSLDINKQLVWLLGATVFIIPYRSIQENLIIEADEIFQVGNKRYLEWQGQMIPLFQISDLFKGNILIPGIGVGKALEEPPSTGYKAPLRLVIKLEKKNVALESSIEKLITQPKLVIDRFTAALSPAEYCYGFTVLEDERLATVIDLDLLLKHTLSQPPATHDAIALPEEQESQSVETPFPSQINSIMTSGISPTVLVIDNTQDRKSDLSFMLEGEGYQVLQLKSGQEAIAKLRNYSGIKLVICEFKTHDLSDIMFLNELMFLAYRLKDLHLAKIPFVLISSCRSSRLQTVSMLMGATTYFNKPYDLKEFSAKIKQIMKLA